MADRPNRESEASSSARFRGRASDGDDYAARQAHRLIPRDRYHSNPPMHLL